MVDFPNSPVDGQLHTEEGTTWVWRDPPQVWSVAGGSAVSLVWYDVLADRLGGNTAYQNTTGNLIFVSLCAQSVVHRAFEISADGVNWMEVARLGGFGNIGDNKSGCVPVPAGYFHRTAATTAELQFWNELRPAPLPEAATAPPILAGAVGSYAFLREDVSGSAVNPNDIVDGADMRYTDVNFEKGPTPEGTWRCMGYADASGYGTLYLRIT